MHVVGLHDERYRCRGNFTIIEHRKNKLAKLKVDGMCIHEIAFYLILNRDKSGILVLRRKPTSI